MPLPQQKIGDWSPTELIKVVKDTIDRQPPPHLPSVVVGSGTVTGSLDVSKAKLVFSNMQFIEFGNNGTPAYENGWTIAPRFPLDKPWEVPGYLKDPLGFLRLRGAISGGTIGSPAFTLLPGARPAQAASFIVPTYNAAGTLVPGTVRVGTDGTITPADFADNSYVVLDGINVWLN